ncbi:MAG: VCBS repeat-containing protein [Nannocystaceae bacterium]|nr:VCBS repeat-containing protein [Nannocystaceae bacterium]
MRRRVRWTLTLAAGVACGGPDNTDPFATNTSATGSSTGGGGSMSASTTVTTGADSSDGSDGAGPKLDLLQPDLDPDFPPPSCKVVDGMDAVGECGTQAPPDSFEPDVQWSWDGGAVISTPLVANLTDDDGNGEIDLCDTPDIVVAAASGLGAAITILDGATGVQQQQFGTIVNSFVTPALGDLDGDGVAEIVSATGAPLLGQLAVVAFDNHGTVLWQTEPMWPQDQGGALGIADFDNDGSPEVYADGFVLRADGTLVFQAPAQTGWFLAQRNTASVAVDLDGDDDLELVLGQAAYHHDGSQVYADTTIKPGYPQIANLDDDDDPEIIVNNDDGITVLEHDGTAKYRDQKPTGDAGLGAWFRPSTVHDFDGDGESDFAVSSAASYSVYDRNLDIQWTAPVQDGSGWAAGTAFDFLGAGYAEAMYADEARLFVFDGEGMPLLQVPRSSQTLIEYPVVADVDNDGSAEIVVVSSNDWDGNQTAPSVQVIRDAEDRWIQARRIWNQHTYHVTNVREDGTIPAVEPKSWLLLNTYRTNAQIENGSVCQPPAG